MENIIQHPELACTQKLSGRDFHELVVAVVDLVRRARAGEEPPIWTEILGMFEPPLASIASVLIEQDALEEYRTLAKEGHHCDGAIEVDDDAKVSIGEDDPGAYVQAWIWVCESVSGDEEIKEEEDKIDVDE